VDDVGFTVVTITLRGCSLLRPVLTCVNSYWQWRLTLSSPVVWNGYTSECSRSSRS